jgi:hypothetical protein
MMMISNRLYIVADHDDYTDERDLLNFTCTELDDEADADGDGDVDTDDEDIKNQLRNVLSNESICRGFYKVLDKQGDCIDDPNDHSGEKILSRPTVFADIAYFTSYQPVYDDPCNPLGTAYSYAIDFSYGTSVFNYSSGVGGEDTYIKIGGSSIPSGVRIITRGGSAAGLISAGGSISGVGEDQSTTIPGPP